MLQEIQQAATATHNDFVKAKSKTMKTQRLEALGETKTPAYSLTHGFSEVRGREEGTGQKKPSADEGLKSVPVAVPDFTNDVVHKEIAGEGLESVASAVPDSTADVVQKDIAGEGLKSVAIAEPDSTADIGHKDIGGKGLKSVAIAEPDSTADVGHKDIGGEESTTVGINTEGPTSTGGNAIAGGTVVDSGQTTTHNPTAPPVPHDEADEQTQGDTHGSSGGDVCPYAGGHIEQERQGGFNDEALTTDKPQILQTPPVLHLGLAMSTLPCP